MCGRSSARLRRVGASAFSADYRAGQLLPQESHPSQHSCLSSASPTRQRAGQERWHGPAAPPEPPWGGFGGLSRGEEKPTCVPGDPSLSPSLSLSLSPSLSPDRHSRWMQSSIICAQGLLQLLPCLAQTRE